MKLMPEAHMSALLNSIAFAVDMDCSKAEHHGYGAKMLAFYNG
jgi:hypothetical protein